MDLWLSIENSEWVSDPTVHFVAAIELFRTGRIPLLVTPTPVYDGNVLWTLDGVTPDTRASHLD